jgi:hypothetical protein
MPTEFQENVPSGHEVRRILVCGPTVFVFEGNTITIYHGDNWSVNVAKASQAQIEGLAREAVGSPAF